MGEKFRPGIERMKCSRYSFPVVVPAALKITQENTVEKYVSKSVMTAQECP